MSRNNAANELFKRLYGRPSSETSQQELFAELYKQVPPEEYTAALKRLADAANDKTADLRAAKDEAQRAFLRLNDAYDLCWREAWAQARAEMVLEDVK